MSGKGKVLIPISKIEWCQFWGEVEQDSPLLRVPVELPEEEASWDGWYVVNMCEEQRERRSAEEEEEEGEIWVYSWSFFIPSPGCFSTAYLLPHFSTHQLYRYTLRERISKTETTVIKHSFLLHGRVKRLFGKEKVWVIFNRVFSQLVWGMEWSRLQTRPMISLSYDITSQKVKNNQWFSYYSPSTTQEQPCWYLYPLPS